jgi:hypothetical protein
VFDTYRDTPSAGVRQSTPRPLTEAQAQIRTGTSAPTPEDVRFAEVQERRRSDPFYQMSYSFASVGRLWDKSIDIDQIDALTSQSAPRYQELFRQYMEFSYVMSCVGEMMAGFPWATPFLGLHGLDRLQSHVASSRTGQPVMGTFSGALHEVLGGTPEDAIALNDFLGDVLAVAVPGFAEFLSGGRAPKSSTAAPICGEGGPCFAAGTPLQTPEGAKAIEELKSGDLVFSRDQHDPTGPIEAKLVEAVFTKPGEIWEVRISGQVIRTTGNHPFFKREAGWTNANELRIGDAVLGMDGQWMAVEEIIETLTRETVYNLRVADFHTYFVGCDEWGFSVWAHNQCTLAEFQEFMEANYKWNPKTSTNAWNRFKLGDSSARDLDGFRRYLMNDYKDKAYYTPNRPAVRKGQEDVVIDFVTCPRARPTLGASPLEMWWDDLGVPVAGPNPNGLRLRAVEQPTVGEGGVYLKREGGKTKTGSTIQFRDRYGTSDEAGIQVEIPQTRTGKPVGVDDSAYPWTPRRQRRFDEEYVDRTLPAEVRYRDTGNPKSPVEADKWAKFRQIFGYGDILENFGH